MWYENVDRKSSRPPEPTAHANERRRYAQHDADQRHGEPHLERVEHRAYQDVLRKDLFVPVEGETGRREADEGAGIEGDDQDDDGRGHEDDQGCHGKRDDQPDAERVGAARRPVVRLPVLARIRAAHSSRPFVQRVK